MGKTGNSTKNHAKLTIYIEKTIVTSAGTAWLKLLLPSSTSDKQHTVYGNPGLCLTPCTSSAPFSQAELVSAVGVRIREGGLTTAVLLQSWRSCFVGTSPKAPIPILWFQPHGRCWSQRSWLLGLFWTSVSGALPHSITPPWRFSYICAIRSPVALLPPWPTCSSIRCSKAPTGAPDKIPGSNLLVMKTFANLDLYRTEVP